jgi:hypothetical protein
MAKIDIIQELNDLGSNLASGASENIYSVPEGYFEAFAEKILGLVKAENDLAFLSSLPKTNPYSVPAGYFDELELNILVSVRAHSDHQTSKEELASISPLLSSLNKEPVFSVPEGYFENFTIKTGNKKQEAKIVSITHRKWFRYAAAAVVTGIVSISAFWYFKQPAKVDPINQPQAWVEKKLKNVSTDDINEFVKMSDEELQSKETAVSVPKHEEIKNLMKDVPVQEIDQFLKETEGSDNTEAMPN